MITTIAGQKLLFERMKFLESRIRSLTGSVQNEFQKGEAFDLGVFNGMVNVVESDFNDAIHELSELKADVTNFMRSLAFKGMEYDADSMETGCRDVMLNDGRPFVPTEDDLPF